jgi:hypothetical protein
VESVSALLDDGQDAAALALVMALRLSAFPRATIEEAVREITLPFRATLRSGANALVALVDALGDLPDTTSPDRVREQVGGATACLRNEVVVPLQRLRRLAPEADDPALADKAARVTARLAALTIARLGERETAMALAGEAVALARTGAVKEELAGELRRLCHDHHRQSARAAFGEGDLVTALAHCQLALPLVATPEESLAVRQAIGAIESALDERGRHQAQGRTREIEAGLSKRLELPRTPRAPRLASGGLGRATTPTPPAASTSSTSAAEPDQVADRPTDAVTAPVPIASARPAGGTGEAPVVAAALRRGASAPPAPAAEAPAALVAATSNAGRFSGASGWLPLALPFAAVLVVAVAATAMLTGAGLPWASSHADPTADGRPPSADAVLETTVTPEQAGEPIATDLGGIVTEPDPGGVVSDLCGLTAGPASADQARVDDLRQSITTLDREIAIIVARYPDGRYPAEAEARLVALRDQRGESVETLTALLAAASSASGRGGRPC